ncbi:MAG: homing endonuclease associated repeat-containing protein [Aestuariivirga sp.]
MNFQLDDYHCGIKNEELLAELRRVAHELNKSALTRADNEERGKYGTVTYIRRFGSWFAALEKAGLEKTRTPMNLSEPDRKHVESFESFVIQERLSDS